MTTTPSRDLIHAEMERAHGDFRTLVQNASATDLARMSDGTCWTNRQRLFHMMFGYLIAWNLRPLVKLVTRLPLRGQRAFAAPLDAASRPFHLINYWGSCAGARIVSPSRMADWFDRVIASLHRHLDAETEAALHRSMAFRLAGTPTSPSA